MIKKRSIITAFILLSTSMNVFAAGFEDIKPADPFADNQPEQNEVQMNIPKKQH